MCYFVEINLSRQELEKRFKVPMIQDLRYMQSNILSAFSKPYLPVITSGQPHLIQNFQWGLIPSWVKDQETANKISFSTYNARAESIFEKASFKTAARSQRCLILAHGFFEWHTYGKQKIPFYIKRKDNNAFAFGGLYEKWKNPENDQIIETVSIITTVANPLLKKIHNSKMRMPVILEEKYEEGFIEAGISENRIVEFLKPLDEEQLEAYPIDKKLFLHHKNPMDPKILSPSTDMLMDDLFQATLF